VDIFSSTVDARRPSQTIDRIGALESYLKEKKLSGPVPLNNGNCDFLWRDGELLAWSNATVHVRSVAHAAVTGVFEGIRAYRDVTSDQVYVYRLPEHMARLIDSCKLTRLALGPTQRELETAVVGVLRANEIHIDAYLRVSVFSAGLSTDLLVDEHHPTHVVIECWPSPKRGSDRTVRVCTSSWRRVGNEDMVPRAKTFANYQQARLALIDASNSGFDAPLFLNSQGFASEGVGAAFAIVKNNKVILPSMSTGILPSITRKSVMSLAIEHLGIPCEEREFDRYECALADEAMFLGTGWEILPIDEIDRIPLSDRNRPITRLLSGEYERSTRRGLQMFAEWCWPVW